MPREALQLAPEVDQVEAPHDVRTTGGPGGEALWHHKPKSLGTDRLNERERAGALVRLPVLNRPTNRSECRDGPRPCPWASCRYHLLVDVVDVLGDADVDEVTTAPKLRFPGLPEWRDEDVVAERYALHMLAVEVTRTRLRPERFRAKVRVGSVVIKATAHTEELAREKLGNTLRLFLEEDETELDLSPLEHTCALDVADEGPHELEEIGRLLNVTMERARQYGEEALEAANLRGRREGWAERVTPQRRERIHRAAVARRAEPLVFPVVP